MLLVMDGVFDVEWVLAGYLDVDSFPTVIAWIVQAFWSGGDKERVVEKRWCELETTVRSTEYY
jgi:hypothetical protein